MPNQVLTEAIDRVASGEDLPADDAAAVLDEIMRGETTEVETAAFLIALRTKGETVEEIVGLARTMRGRSLKVETSRDDLLDTAGTAAGRSGSADVLEALGARIDLPPEAVAECIDECGFGFMFAPHHHQAMRFVVPVRKELGVRTIFNFLGPLTNPAGAGRQLIGVSDARYLDTIAAALRGLGGTTALVVSSEDGLDEISVSAPTRAVELKGGEIASYSITPWTRGIDPLPAERVGAADPDRSAEIARAVLSGAGGAERALTVANAAAAIYVGGVAESLTDGVRTAEHAIDSGSAR